MIPSSVDSTKYRCLKCVLNSFWDPIPQTTFGAVWMQICPGPHTQSTSSELLQFHNELKGLLLVSVLIHWPQHNDCYYFSNEWSPWLPDPKGTTHHYLVDQCGLTLEAADSHFSCIPLSCNWSRSSHMLMKHLQKLFLLTCEYFIY